MRTTTFGYAPEAGANPHCGISSFQHFAGEELYSDIVVRPENNMTETERVEGYPVPAGVAQRGRAEGGYYPDGKVAYIRVLWKDYEPARGEYRDGFVEDILSRAARAGQTVMFRLMPHSTRESDDVPDWLKGLIPCPARPAGARVKDSPTDPRFLQWFGEAIRHLGERYDGDPRLEAVDICLPGAWGEGYKTELYPAEDLERLMDAYTEAFPRTVLLGQLRRPDLVRHITATHPVGWRGDGMGNDYLMKEYYPKQLAQMPADLWQTAPVACESYWWLGEWMRQGWDPAPLFSRMLAWHVTYFNAKSLPIPTEWREETEAFIRKMGYHFRPVMFACPEQARPGETVTAVLTVENAGVAPMYHPCPVHLRLRQGERKEYFALPAADPRTWLPGKTEMEIVLPLPADLPTGEWEIALGLGDPKGAKIYLCTDAPRDGRFYTIGNITVK